MRSAAAKFLAVIAAAAAMPGVANAASGSVTVNASVLKPILLTGGGTLDFGTIATPSTSSYSGTFTIDAAASQTTAFCAANFTCTGSPRALMFNIQGTKSNPITLSIPRTVTLTLQNYAGGGATPTLTLNTANSLFANNSTGNYTLILPNSGIPGVDFYVAGQLTIDQNTSTGAYAGSLTITADYQ